MKKSIIFISVITLIITICFSGCYKTLYKYINDPVSGDEIFVYKSTQEHSTKESSSMLTTEIETIESETTAKRSSNSDTTTRPAEQKSAVQTTTKKQSETTTQKVNSQTTAAICETTKAVVTTKKQTTKKETTTKKPASTTEKSFDVNYWVSYAKNYAESIGLNLDSSATECWDNPINANTKCIYLERDIQSRLNRYAKDDDITDVWIWAEKVSENSYQIYIGYA